MVVTDFAENFQLYENMSIWEIPNMETFFKAHETLPEIFEKEYGFPYSEKNDSDKKIPDGDLVVISKLLDHFGDKHFFIFTKDDLHHDYLKTLQDSKTINFGIDIHVIHPKKIFVLEMDKTKDMQKYDN